MNFTQTYLDDNGYDYFGNAAEDTLMFFVYDESPSLSEQANDRSNEDITNLSDNTAYGISGGLSSEVRAANTETHAVAYQENGKDTSTTFNIGRDNAPVDNESGNVPISNSAASPYSETNVDDCSNFIPKLSGTDLQQTETKHITDAGFKL